MGTTRDKIFRIRAPAATQALIDRAAMACQMSRADFLFVAACEKAREVVFHGTSVALDDLALTRIETAPDEADKTNVAIRQLFDKPAPWER